MKKSLLLATILGLGTTGPVFAEGEAAPSGEAAVEKAPQEKEGEHHMMQGKHHSMKGKKAGRHHAMKKKMRAKMEEMHKEGMKGQGGTKAEDMPPMGPEMHEKK